MARRKRLPVEDVPAKRPHCAMCAKPLEMWATNIFPERNGMQDITAEPLRRVFFRWKGYEPFCTLRCALRFARGAYRDGYRVVKRRAS